MFLAAFDIIWLAYLILLLLAIGSRINKMLNLGLRNRLEDFIFSLSLGLAVLSYFTFAVGVLGFLYRWVIYAVLGMLTILFLGDMRRLARSVFISASQSLSRIWKGSKEFYLFLIIFSIFSAVTFIEAFAPVASWDSLAYHMAAAKFYIGQHRIYSIPTMIASNWPSAIDMLYLFGLIARSDILSQLLSWLITMTLVLSIYSFSLRYFSVRVAQFAALVFCSIPLVNLYAAVTYVDLGTALFLMLAVYSFINWMGDKKASWLIICSINCGMAAWSKLNAVLVIPLAAFTIFLLGLKDKGGLKKAFKDITIFLVVSLSICSGWYIKTWITTGNPVFPYCYKIFGGRDWNSFTDSIYTMVYSGAQLKSIFDFIFLPVNWTLGLQDTSVGVLFLVFIPIALFNFRKLDRAVKVVLIAALIFFIPFALVTNQARFYFVGLALCSIVVGYEINRIWPNGKLLGIFLLALVFLATTSWNMNLKKDKMLTALGLVERDLFLIQNTPFYRQFQWINKNTPPESRILIWAIHGYYLDRDYLWVSPPIQGVIDFSKIKDARQMLERMRQLGVTHIFYVPKDRITVPFMGDFLDRLYAEMKQTGKLSILKEWRYNEILSNGRVEQTFLCSVEY